MRSDMTKGHSGIWAIVNGMVAVSILAHAVVVIFDVADTNWDFDAHFAWAIQFSEAFRDGNLYPRWMPLGNNGLGEPVTLFYSPLFYFLVSISDSVMPYTWASIKLIMCLSTLVVGFGTWLLLRPMTSALWAFIGTAAVQTAPMIFMIFHYFNGFPWGTSFAAYTFVVALSVRFFTGSQAGFSPLLALAAATLVFAHIVSAVMAFLCLSVTLLALALIGRTTILGRIAWIFWWGVSVAIGISLAMVYLWPALTSMDLVAASNWQDRYPPQDAFAFPTITAFLFGMRWFTFQWVVPALVLASVVLVTFAYHRWAHELADGTRKTLLLLLLLSWVSLFFSSEISYPLWIGTSPLLWVQSPHRFIYITTLPALAMNAFWLGWLWSRGTWAFRGIFGIPIVASVFLCGLMIMRILIVGESMTTLKTNRVMPYGSYSEYQVAAQTPEAMTWVKQGGLDTECRTKGLRCESVPKKRYVWRLETERIETVRLPILSFPSWKLTVGGVVQDWHTDMHTGLIEINLRPGVHTVGVSWERLPQELTGARLSIGAMLGFVGLTLGRRYRRNSRAILG